MKKMKHRFYTKTQKERNQILLLIGFSAFVVIILSLLVSWITGFYLIVFLIFSIVLSIIAPFFDTPSLKKSGAITYHSLLFLSEKPKNGVLIIHGGTLFDYVFVLDKKMNGTLRTKFILQQYLQGLLNLIEQYEINENGNLKVRGTSYIINESTAKRIGFTINKTDFVQKMILTYNYFNILISASIAKDKLSFPNLNDTKTFEATLIDLVERKEYIRNLNSKLKSTVASRG
jgi:hypothetical protein